VAVWVCTAIWVRSTGLGEWIGLGESAWRYVGELGREVAPNRSGWCVGFVPGMTML
jgi:hypothetical protein